MERGTLPHDILRFVADSIDSVPHLEALLLLWDHSDKTWTEEDIAQRVYIPTDKARLIVQDLTRLAFLLILAAIVWKNKGKREG